MEEIYAGTAYIIEKTLSEQEVKRLKSLALEFESLHEATRLKIVDDCPDWHEINDGSQAPAGGYQVIGHSYYFFRWNNTGEEIFNIVRKHWEIGKIFNGYPPNAFEKNIPANGSVDRIQIIHYPKSGGSISGHIDPDYCYHSLMGFQLSTRGKDYQSGGFFIVDKFGKEQLIQSAMDRGCLISWAPSLPHGVQPVDSGLDLDWSPKTGRWFLVTNSAEAHTAANRHYAIPYKPKQVA